MAGVKGKSGSGGKRPNAGRKPKEQSDELKALFDEACPIAQRKEIIRVMTARAQSGDSKAAAFVFDRIYGTPIQRQQITGEGGGPVGLRIEYVNDWRGSGGSSE